MEEDNEALIEQLNARRDEITSDTDKFIVEIQDKLMKSIEEVDERFGENPNISMWEHLQHLLWRTEECTQDVIDEELNRIDATIKSLEE